MKCVVYSAEEEHFLQLQSPLKSNAAREMKEQAAKSRVLEVDIVEEKGLVAGGSISGHPRPVCNSFDRFALL